jgi:asparagine synthase (glutamine-hydrolysing)
MAGIAGVFQTGETFQVDQMLESISHRGEYGKVILEFENATIGIVWAQHEDKRITELTRNRIFRDGPGHGHSAEVLRKNNHWEISRDELGVAPLYTAFNSNGIFTFASEAKALLLFSDTISEMLPGYTLTASGLKQNFKSGTRTRIPVTDTQAIATELSDVLNHAVKKCIKTDKMGAWLIGGFDSAIVAALAKQHVGTLHTFAGGLKDAPQLKSARQVAEHIGAEHHEVIITKQSIIGILPDVIHQLESFDVSLIRTGLINLPVAFTASEFVQEVFSGEGGYELFTGHHFLDQNASTKHDPELINITSLMHNSSLQRAERSASAFGTTAHLIFTDPDVVEYALKIPSGLKLHKGTDQWILRKAMQGILPENIVYKHGAGLSDGVEVGTLISGYASTTVTDSDFKTERKLRNGWILNTKEELLYYRIFKEYFGELDQLAWMGRTKNYTSS